MWTLKPPLHGPILAMIPQRSAALGRREQELDNYCSSLGIHRELQGARVQPLQLTADSLYKGRQKKDSSCYCEGSYRTIMKWTVLLLAIGLVAGAQARSLFQDEPQTKWESALDSFWQTLNKVEEAADEATQRMREFQIGKELDSLIKETMEEVSIYADGLKSKVSPMAQDAQQLFNDEVSALADKLKNDMEDTKSRVIQYSGDLRSMLDQNIESVQTKVNMYMKKFKKRLTKDSEELKQKLNQYREDISKNTQEKVESIRQSIEPFASNWKKKGEERFQSLKDAMDEQGKQLRERFASVAKDVQEKVKKMTSDVKSSVEKLSDQMREWLNPSIDNLRNQFQSLAKSLQNKEQ